MAYHSYPGDGYETGPARIGPLAECRRPDVVLVLTVLAVEQL